MAKMGWMRRCLINRANNAHVKLETGQTACICTAPVCLFVHEWHESGNIQLNGRMRR